jgi:PAS domain S-box-containing protein
MINYIASFLHEIVSIQLSKKKLIYLLAILLVILVAGIILLYLQYSDFQSIAYNRLLTIAENKKKDIGSWLKDQTDDADLLIKSGQFRNLLQNYFTYNNAESYNILYTFLDFYVKNNDISEVLLVNNDGTILFSLYKHIKVVAQETLHYLQYAAATNKPVFTDIHIDNKDFDYHISLIVPLNPDSTAKSNHFIILISSAQNFIFPLLQRWTGFTQSGETILFAKDKSTLYIFKSYLPQKIPEIIKVNTALLSPDNIIRKAMNGFEGFTYGKDLHDISVGTYITSIPNTPWIILSKSSKAELFQRWYVILTISIALFILSIILLFSIIILMQKEQQRTYFQELSHKKEEQLKIYQIYKYIIQSIGNGLIITDNSGNIEFINTTAELLTGWRNDDANGMHVLDVLHILSQNNTIPSKDNLFQIISKGKFKGEYHTSVLISKTGLEIPINYHGTILKSGDNQHLGAVILIEDQTRESFLNLINDIRLKFINFSINHTKDDFIKKMLHEILTITNSHIGCYISYKYLYKQITSLKEFPNSYHTYCIDQNIDCSVDYEKVWDECQKNKGPILNNEYTQYFYCEQLLNGKNHPRELFVPIFRENNIVGIIGVANKHKDYTYADVSKLSILSDMVYEILSHKDNEEAYRNLVMLSNELACIADLKTTRFLLVNPSFLKTLGYSVEELTSASFLEFIHPDDKEKTIQIIKEKLLKGEDVITFENRYRCKDGSYVWLDWNSHPVASQGITFATAHNITERKIAEEALKENEKKFRELFTHSNDGICLHELVYDNTGDAFDYKIVDVNPQYENILSLKKEDVIGKLSTELYKTSEPPYFEIYKEVALTGKSTTFETYYAPMEKYFIISVFSPQKGQFATVFKDITEFKLAAKKIEESEEKFSLFMKNLPLVVVIRDIHGRYIYLNDEWEKVMELNKEDWLGKTPYDVFPKEDAEKLLLGDREAIEKGITEPKEFTLKHKSGIKWWMANRFVLYDENKKPAYVATVYIDITERKKAEEEKEKLKDQLIQAQKLESVGRLAGGVAHDYNNMLEVILGNAQLALIQIESKDDVKNYLEEITKAATRSADITKQLLTFARKQISEPHIVNINTIIENMLKMLRRLIGEDIDLQWILNENLWNVYIDPVQLNQIIANLCVNARDAIQSNGIITIKTKNVTLDEEYCKDIPDCLPGEYVMLSVSDNGIGIDKEIIGKIFEPFFTTKEVGKGTGLGLATVYGIVKQHHGFINVYSEKGKGTTFNIYLPRYRGPQEAVKSVISDSWVYGNGETILVVEDEPSLLKMVQVMLERLNYTVLSAQSPAEAINIVKSKGQSIQLMITDFIMPIMDGLQLAQEVAKLSPHIKFLFMSGYTDRILFETNSNTNKETNFLHKPFSISELAKKIHEIL